MSGILNLKKNDLLDLTKKDPSLTKLMVGAGWDAVKSQGLFRMKAPNIDLDLMAYLLDEKGRLIRNGHVYFGHKDGAGVHLNGDNLTGAGEGDDEQIRVDLSQLPSNCKCIKFAVCIYSNHVFSQVENAYVRLVDMSGFGEKELCRFNLTEDGGNHNAIIMSELVNDCGNWQFKAIGEFTNASGKDLANRFN